MIIPAGHRVMVKAKTLEEFDPVYASAKRAGLIVQEQTERQEQTAIDQGIVIALGSTAFADFGGTPWCKVGDIVAYARHSGKFVTDPFSKEKMLILNDEDICCVFKEQE